MKLTVISMCVFLHRVYLTFPPPSLLFSYSLAYFQKNYDVNGKGGRKCGGRSRVVDCSAVFTFIFPEKGLT